MKIAMIFMIFLWIAYSAAFGADSEVKGIYRPYPATEETELVCPFLDFYSQTKCRVGLFEGKWKAKGEKKNLVIELSSSRGVFGFYHADCFSSGIIFADKLRNNWSNNLLERTTSSKRIELVFTDSGASGRNKISAVIFDKYSFGSGIWFLEIKKDRQPGGKFIMYFDSTWDQIDGKIEISGNFGKNPIVLEKMGAQLFYKPARIHFRKNGSTH